MSTPSNPEHFRAAFREEALDLLEQIETGLMNMEEANADGEEVSAVFRSLHTIKGSGAMFGFTQLAAFTHHLENAFDAVRSGKQALTCELVALSLKSIDQMRGLVLDDGSSTDIARCAIVGQVSRLLVAEPQPAQPTATDGVGETDASEELRKWKICFSPGPDTMRAGADPVLLIRELGSLGSLQVNAALGQLPSLEEMDPERCYISWTLELLACTDLNAIKDIFIFVEDTCELSIECLPSEKTLTEPLPTSGAVDTIAKQESSSTRASRPATTENVAGIRVKTAKLDQLVNLVGELVTVQARLSEIASRNDDSDICAVAEEIERLSSALRDSTMNIRMMPIRDTFERFRRLVYDLASDLQKNVRLTIEGADTELDKTVIDHLGDPLLHLIRNCMDHGLETPAERLESGKPAQGNVHLSARYAGASVLIKVTDDGRGINVARVRQRGIERGLIAADAALTDSQLFALIFEPGFSTVNEVTDLSGRGVGMDVVHRNIDKLRGSIDISSELGKGTSITLRIPLTLAIIDGLLVTVGDQYFVLPLAHALECIELSRSQIDAANGKQLIKVRGDIVAYIRLRDYFGIDGDLPDFEQVMLVTTEVGRYGLVVDRVLGDCQTMVKSLGRMYRDVNELSGATVLGNGSVALILDPHRLVQECIRGAEVPSRRPARTFAPDAWERADLTAAGSTSSFTNSNHTASADATGVLHA